MAKFPDAAWSKLMSLIESDDGDSIYAIALELRDSGVLDGSHPKDDLHRTPVMISYWYNHLSAAAALVRSGADYQKKDSKGRSVTWYAQHFGKGENEGVMSLRIAVTQTRLSMESVIREKSGTESKTETPQMRSRRTPRV